MSKQILFETLLTVANKIQENKKNRERDNERNLRPPDFVSDLQVRSSKKSSIKCLKEGAGHLGLSYLEFQG